MVDKLGPLSQVMLRLQQARGGVTGAKAAPPPDARAAKGQGAAVGPAKLPVRERVLQRLAAVDPDDPKRRQRAFRAFVEVRLLDTFGEQLGNDAGFQQLVDDVSQVMQGDEGLRGEIAEAVEMLLAPAD